MKPKAPIILLALLIAGSAAVNLYWCSLAAPAFGGFDEANHLGRIFAYAEHEAHHAPDPTPDQPIQWPPLFHRFAARLWIATGYSHVALQLMWTAMFALLLIAAYLLAEHLAGSWAGLSAAIFTATAPEVAHYSRTITLDMPLAACTAWAFYFLARADGMRKFGTTLLFGAAAGLACMAKGYAPVYLLVPAAAALLLGGPFADFNKRGANNPLFNAALGSLAGTLVVTGWYGGRMDRYFATLTEHLGEVSRNDAGVTIAQSIVQMIGPFVPLLFLLGLALTWRQRREIKMYAPLLAWVVVPAGVFAVAPATYSRFLMPALPAVAILAAVGIARLEGKKIRLAVTATTAVLTLSLYLALSLAPFSAPLKSKQFLRPPLTQPGAVELAAEAVRFGSVTIDVEATHPYLPAGMLGYLVRLADGNVPIAFSNATQHRPTEAVLLLEIAGYALPPHLAENYAPVRKAEFAYGAMHTTLHLLQRKTPPEPSPDGAAL